MQLDIPIYCISYGNPDRIKRLKERFDAADVNVIFFDPTALPNNQENVKKVQDLIKDNSTWFRVWIMTVYHLEMMKAFLATNASHGIFCEDDIHIRKTFKQDLPGIVNDFDRMKLDILLLGYLLAYSPRLEHSIHPLKSNQYTYHEYPDDQWGAQMYMLSRKQAQYFVDKYTPQWASENLTIPYCGDWIFTKDGNRAIIYPMLAVEDGCTNATDPGQIIFHKSCFDAQYNPNFYI